MREASTMGWLRENIFVLRRRPEQARAVGPHGLAAG